MTPAGWYPDAESDEVIRYWDGAQWLEQRAWSGSEWVLRPLGSPVVPVAAAPPPPPVVTDLPPPPVVAEPPPPPVVTDLPPPPVVAEPPPPPVVTDLPPPPVVAEPPAPPVVTDLPPPPVVAEPPPPPPVEPPPPADPPPPPVAADLGLTGTVAGASPSTPPPAALPAPPPPTSAVPPAAAPGAISVPIVPVPEARPLTADSDGGARWRRPAALVALGLLVAGASGAITYLVRRDDTTSAASVTPVSSRPAPVHRTTTSTTSTSTTSTTTLPFGPQPAAVIGRVARTCGASGRGDCFVSLRSAPNGAAPEVGRLLDGQAIVVVCQVPGEAVTSSALGRSSTAWSRTADGKYVASIYVDAVGFDPLGVAIPCP